MNPKLNRGSLSLILVSLILVGIPGCVCQNDYDNCRREFVCGSLSNIRYPFYGGNRPLSCGYPGFQLNCSGQGDPPLINISSMIYRVLQIEYQTQVLRVARNDLWSTPCTQTPVNTTFNTSLYSLYSPAGDQDITLYYGCAGPIPPTGTLPNLFPCGSTQNFFVTRESSLTAFGLNVSCDDEISVRVTQTAAAQLANTPSVAVLQTTIQSGFSIRWSVDDDRCSSCVGSSGVCGYNQNSSSFTCLCSDGSYVGTACPNAGGSNGSDWPKVEVTVVICVLVLAILSIAYCLRKHPSFHALNQESNENVERFLLNHGSLAPKRYDYNDIKKMTKSFKEKVGQGGFGIVYKGKLPDGRVVAVKVLTETEDNAEEFMNEVASISRTSHFNIVNLLGFCYHGNKRALVYEFMPNKSLDKFIYKHGSTGPDCSLEVDRLYEIALGVARGLEYLHRGCNTRIVHFDIKPQNILLDEDFSPKISDFGLAKLVKKEQSVISMLGARGTIGYIAPEVFSRNFGVVSHKSDVYNYGMLLIDMVGARNMEEIESIQSSENYFPEKIYEYMLMKNRKVEEFTEEEKEESVRKMLMVGIWCIQTSPSDRPSMSKVVEMLEGSPESIQIPPKPFFPSHNLSGSTELSSSENTSYSGNPNQQAAAVNGKMLIQQQ